MVETALYAIGWALAGAGSLFLLAGGVGILRLPDFYTRTHAVGVIDTLGIGLPLVALALQMGLVKGVFKVVLILLFLLITTPVTTHAITRAARHHDHGGEG